LSGRKFIFELFPLTFREFLLFKESPLKIPETAVAVSRAVFGKVAVLYDEYMLYGGFPGVVLKEKADEKKRALEDIFNSFFQLEVLQLGDFRRNDIIRDLMLLLMERIGSKLDIQKLSKELGTSRPTLKEYISFLEGTYFIKTIKPFSRGRSSEIRKTPKVYLCDTGLANHLARVDRGGLFENSVFQCLRTGNELNYYRKKSGIEIDFIVDKEKAYEVKLSPSLSDLRKLRETAARIGLNKTGIVSKNYSEVESILYGFML
jgi:predicted AAA+ superfamily ATPase